MANIQIEIPDDQVPRVLEAFAERFGWSAETGMTRPQFTKAVVANWIKRQVRIYEQDKAENTARQAMVTVTNVDVT